MFRLLFCKCVVGSFRMQWIYITLSIILNPPCWLPYKKGSSQNAMEEKMDVPMICCYILFNWSKDESSANDYGHNNSVHLLHLHVKMDLTSSDLEQDFDYSTGVCFDSDDSDEFTNNNSLGDDNTQNENYTTSTTNVELNDRDEKGEESSHVSKLNENNIQYNFNDSETENDRENNG